MIQSGAGQAYIKSAPRCPVHHGQMREDFAMDQWTCAGWDGEGCDHVVRNEDVPWVHIGEITELNWDLSSKEV